MHHQHCGEHEHGHCGECGHHHGHGGSCGHEQGDCGQEGHEEGGHIEEFFGLAKKAWEKLMVEKIKAEMDRMEGDKFNRLAKLIAETKFKKFRAKKAKMQAMHEFQEQLEQIMCDQGQ